MDTGLGRDGYSIIGQGKIDSILSTKSEDRRQIFEEAAGISKYNTKLEAERKLVQTVDNLTSHIRIESFCNYIFHYQKTLLHYHQYNNIQVTPLFY